MKVVFHSFTDNVRRFIQRTKLKDTFEITNSTLTEKMKEPFILVTSTIGFGEIPPVVQEFLNHNQEYIQGVAASGNRIWGRNFAKAGQLIAQAYNVPLLMKFELHGTQKDTIEFRDKVVNFHENNRAKILQSY
ncbi:class Ib ribonucleoside-diphosphate reductase assembly flavoprotein NrdI [Staphylococcus felis]|uniref:class Ib ribonucleoside-diphosphate reductase assembly flavoprotein NrdI n=1 Tax=Staphylococcus felis TaxID=46127 RepID=UPI000E28A8A0|nr:class Ib ribonucleoside-diphosphate reductase assembly flavoprotein NrdI [Staphylococcus felis]REH88063.1 class Ib ribonucleoside-diphosphate reductase assembly flavoprotein NrdI [Staphylococcus felis]